MQLEINDLKPFFGENEDLFEKTMKGLFKNHYSYEETELHFFFIEETDDFHAVYFDFNLIPESFAKIDKEKTDIINYEEKINRYLQEHYNGRKYFLEKSESKILEDKTGKQFVRIIWVFFSECLNSGLGVLLQKNAFRQLAKIFNRCWEMYPVENQETASCSQSRLVQELLYCAEEETRKNLEMLFAPLDLRFVDQLSGEYYEKAECQSNLIFLPSAVVQNIKDSEKILQYRFGGIGFEEKNDKTDVIEFSPQCTRQIRKLLQIAQGELYLILGEDDKRKSFVVLGVCSKKKLEEKVLIYENQIIPYIKIYIRKHMQWELFIMDGYILSAINGKYKIICKPRREYLVNKFTEYFGKRKDNYNALIRCIYESMEQGHGTMLVIMRPQSARGEVKRLGIQNYGLPEDIAYNRTKIINKLNAIDGSVFIDTSGRIYGIGMIIDGVISEKSKKGDMARGARFNSAWNYLSNFSERLGGVLILVVSEDGSIDILPYNEEKVKKK